MDDDAQLDNVSEMSQQVWHADSLFKCTVAVQYLIDEAVDNNM